MTEWATILRKTAACLVWLTLATALHGQTPAASAETALEPAASPGELEKRFPPLRDVEIPEVPSHTLSNGMTVYLLEDHTLPVIAGTALVRTGNLFDPPDKAGLAEITGSVLRVGGTKSRTGDEIDQELESLAASVEMGIGETSGHASFWTLKENIGVVLATYADILMNPAFRQDKLDFVKQQVRSGIARRNDDPSGIAGREFSNLVYGKQTPYGRQVEYEHLDRIERPDLENFYRRYFFPANMTLAVYGDFSSEEIKAELENVFKEWSVRQDQVPPFPPVRRDLSGGLYLVEKQDVNQSNIRLGHLGGLLKDDDYPALEVMSTILGGGFQSRLFRQIRSNLGLAYHASASWGAQYNHPGLFRVALATKSETTVQAIQAVMAEIERMRTEPVTGAELRSAKEKVLNSFVFNFDTKKKTLSRLMTYRYWGYPDDFIFRYKEQVGAVAPDDVLRVAKQYLRPEAMKLVVVGKPEDFDQPLDVLGKAVTKLDVTIPEPEQTLAEADDTSLAKGREILAKAQQAAGGAGNLAAIQDVSKTVKLQVVQGMMSADQTTRIILPDVLRQENQLPFGKVVVFVDGSDGWMQSPQGRMPLPAPQLKQTQGALFRLRETLLLSDRDPARTINFVRQEQVDGRPADIIEISETEGRSVRLWVEASSGDILKSAYQGDAVAGAPAEIEEIYADFREVDGLRIPFQVTIFQNGQKFMEARLVEVKFNSGLERDALAQP